MREAKIKIRIKNDLLIAIKKENPYWRAFYATGYGRNMEEYLLMHPVEVLHLMNLGRAIVFTNDEKEIGPSELLRKFQEKNKKQLWKYYLIYRDIRSRGYNVRVRDSNILPFEIFERGKTPLQHDSFALIAIAESSKPFRLEDLAQAIEEAKKLEKKLLIALIDELGDVTYYSVDEALIEETFLKIYRK